MAPPILAAENVSRRSRDGRWLLRGVWLDVGRGQRWAITGPTGSGKTLLLRALSLLDEADEGLVRWNGEAIPNDRVPAFRRDVLYLHQQPALVEGDVHRNLRLPFELAAFRGTPPAPEQVLGLLEAMGRDESFLHKQSADLSGGEAQIVALLRAMQVNPSVLLLDEPTAALDDEATAAIETLVARWLEKDSQRATVWVSHDRRQQERVAERRLALRSGRVEE